MTRFANNADMPELLSMARAMWAESPNLRDLPLDSDRVVQIAHNLMEDGALLVTGQTAVAFMAFAVFEHPWTGISYASEQALYVSPAYRGAGLALRLVQEAVALARERGCAWFTSGTTTGTEQEATSVVYARAGFAETGRTYRKALVPATVTA